MVSYVHLNQVRVGFRVIVFLVRVRAKSDEVGFAPDIISPDCRNRGLVYVHVDIDTSVLEQSVTYILVLALLLTTFI